MNKIIKVLSVLLFLLMLCSCASGVRFIRTESMDKIVIEDPLDKFTIGEVLSYNVKWLGLPAGKIDLNIAEITQINGRDSYHIIWEGKFNKLISAIMRPNNKINAYIDTEHLLPLRLEEYRISEKQTRKHIVNYNHQKLKTIHDTNGVIKEVSTPKDVHNFLSGIYYLRAKKIDIADSFFIDINTGYKNWRIKTDIVKKGILDITGIGRFNAFMVQPTVINKKGVYKKTKMKFWFSADKRRIPLLINAKTSFFGSLRINLTSIKKGRFTK